jgi:hypothetical protein
MEWKFEVQELLLNTSSRTLREWDKYKTVANYDVT